MTFTLPCCGPEFLINDFPSGHGGELVKAYEAGFTNGGDEGCRLMQVLNVPTTLILNDASHPLKSILHG